LSTKSSGARRNSAEAALDAAARTFSTTPSLPLESVSAVDPAQEGRQRLRGAFLIDLDRIQADPDQPRREFDEEELANLTASIQERGVRQPIRVWYVAEAEMYQIIAGERRYRASKAAGLTAIPCLVEDMPSAQPTLPRVEILVEQISENWQRADLKPLELSNALAELRDALGIGPRELSQRLSKPESEISRLLSLQKIDPSLRESLTADDQNGLTRRHLVAVAKLHPDEQQGFVESVRERKLTAMETEREASHKVGERAGRGAPARRGSFRRFVIGNATVEVRFRKREATDADVLDALDRAARLLREQESANRQ
jgi:ParB family chromosome partitioning protein